MKRETTFRQQAKFQRDLFKSNLRMARIQTSKKLSNIRKFPPVKRFISWFKKFFRFEKGSEILEIDYKPDYVSSGGGVEAYKSLCRSATEVTA